MIDEERGLVIRSSISNSVNIRRLILVVHASNTMPLLKREPDVFPANLFELSATDFPWQVAHVRSRQEKGLARFIGPDPRKMAELTELPPGTVPFYLPQIENTLKSGGRTRSSWIPLFGGYVFFRGGSEQRMKVIKSNLVANIIEVQDQQLLHDQLKQIFEMQQKGLRLLLYPEITTGDMVRISEGVFKGYIGQVIRERDELRLIVSVSAIGKSVVVELGKESLVPVR